MPWVDKSLQPTPTGLPTVVSGRLFTVEPAEWSMREAFSGVLKNKGNPRRGFKEGVLKRRGGRHIIKRSGGV